MKNNNPLISIIIPVYNVEPYLEKCLLSVVNQTYSNLEIILVDDGSPDNCGDICDEWAKKDARIKVFHQENQGVTVARKIGVEKSSGDWICFVDSDDELPENSLQILLNAITEDTIDIIIGSVQYTHKWPYKKRHSEITGLDFVKLLLKNKVHGGPCARLFKKNLFNKKTFDIPHNIISGEDFIMNVRLGQDANKVRIIPNIVYFYIKREGSAVSKNPYLKRKYRHHFKGILLKSIHKKNEKRLRGAVRYCIINRRWRWLKQQVKNLFFSSI